MSSNADYDRAATRLRQPPRESTGDDLDLRECVRLGILAASSHNTQPWRFRIDNERLIIRPDFSRRCRVVDPDDAHLYKSLGCAAENVVQGAAAQDRTAQVRYDPGDDAIHIDFGRGAARDRLELARAIPVRQCTKLAYDGRPVPTDQLRALEAAGTGRHVRTMLITDRVRLAAVAEYVASGDREQLADPAWRRELLQWIRFNPREAIATGDGLSGRTTEQPSLPRWLGPALLRLVLTGSRQAAIDTQNMRSSAGVAVTLTRSNDRADWVECGRAWQRFALRATALGIRTAFINQPIEVAALRTQFVSWLGLRDEHPLLMVRFGFGPVAPYSLRRPLEDVLDHDGGAHRAVAA